MYTQEEQTIIDNINQLRKMTPEMIKLIIKTLMEERAYNVTEIIEMKLAINPMMPFIQSGEQHFNFENPAAFIYLQSKEHDYLNFTLKLEYNQLHLVSRDEVKQFINEFVVKTIPNKLEKEIVNQMINELSEYLHIKEELLKEAEELEIEQKRQLEESEANEEQKDYQKAKAKFDSIVDIHSLNHIDDSSFSLSEEQRKNIKKYNVFKKANYFFDKIKTLIKEDDHYLNPNRINILSFTPIQTNHETIFSQDIKSVEGYFHVHDCLHQCLIKKSNNILSFTTLSDVQNQLNTMERTEENEPIAQALEKLIATTQKIEFRLDSILDLHEKENKFFHIINSPFFQGESIYDSFRVSSTTQQYFFVPNEFTHQAKYYSIFSSLTNGDVEEHTQANFLSMIQHELTSNLMDEQTYKMYDKMRVAVETYDVKMEKSKLENKIKSFRVNQGDSGETKNKQTI